MANCIFTQQLNSFRFNLFVFTTQICFFFFLMQAPWPRYIRSGSFCLKQYFNYPSVLVKSLSLLFLFLFSSWHSISLLNQCSDLGKLSLIKHVRKYMWSSEHHSHANCWLDVWKFWFLILDKRYITLFPAYTDMNTSYDVKNSQDCQQLWNKGMWFN